MYAFMRYDLLYNIKFSNEMQWNNIQPRFEDCYICDFSICASPHVGFSSGTVLAVYVHDSFPFVCPLPVC